MSEHPGMAGNVSPESVMSGLIGVGGQWRADTLHHFKVCSDKNRVFIRSEGGSLLFPISECGCDEGDVHWCICLYRLMTSIGYPSPNSNSTNESHCYPKVPEQENYNWTFVGLRHTELYRLQSALHCYFTYIRKKIDWSVSEMFWSISWPFSSQNDNCLSYF